MNDGRPATGLCPRSTPTASVPSAAIGLPSCANAGRPLYVVSRRTAGSPLPVSATYVSTPSRHVSNDTLRVPPPPHPPQLATRHAKADSIPKDRPNPPLPTRLPLLTRCVIARISSAPMLIGGG